MRQLRRVKRGLTWPALPNEISRAAQKWSRSSLLPMYAAALGHVVTMRQTAPALVAHLRSSAAWAFGLVGEIFAPHVFHEML